MEFLLLVVGIIVGVWSIRLIVRNGGEQAINSIAQASAENAEAWARQSALAAEKSDARGEDELTEELAAKAASFRAKLAARKK